LPHTVLMLLTVEISQQKQRSEVHADASFRF